MDEVEREELLVGGRVQAGRVHGILLPGTREYGDKELALETSGCGSKGWKTLKTIRSF